jgi:DNA helicase-2/ATP-dependent DNA helicase PcrA
VPETPVLAPEPAYLEGLNPPQREAVLTTEGPVLVLAGAGTGKTAALTARLAHLIATRLAWPSQILAVTFTNKAAREMKDRVSAISGGAIEGMPWLGTFHSVAARMLRSHAELVGLQANFTILDTDDQLRVLKQLIQAANLDEKRWPARQLAGLVDRWKNRGWTPAEVDAGEAEAFAAGRGAALYAAYQERLKTLNACDFGDLLLHMLVIFRRHPDVLEGYRNRFRYILVDEYQDTNSGQYEWLRLLAEPRNNLCCVGDDDQSIYSWRGAEVANILRFEKDFPGATIIRLEQNYRSTSHILTAADGLIAHNAGRLGKSLWTDAGEGELVRVIGVWDGPEEARRVGEEAESHMRAGRSLDDIAILVRAQFQTREFEERFIAIGLPYRIIGGFRFYERAEIRDAIAYLRLITQPADDLAFERIVNQPKRGLGDKAVATIHRHARAIQQPLLLAAATLLDSDELTPQARRSLGNFVADIARWRGMLGSSLPQSASDEDPSQAAAAANHAELARIVLEESGYTAMLQADRSAESAGRLENLAELTRAMEDYDSLGGFLEHVSLVMDNDEAREGDRVTIMTIHAANRRIYGQWTSSIPSRFLAELPKDQIEEETTMTGGESLWRAQWSERSDPFAHVARPSRGPGWQRATRTTYNPEPQRIIEARASAVSLGNQGRTDLALGQRVFHGKFGYGTIAAIEGNKLEIDFEKAGRKKVLDSFVSAA